MPQNLLRSLHPSILSPGAHSWVRKQLPIQMEGEQTSEYGFFFSDNRAVMLNAPASFRLGMGSRW